VHHSLRTLCARDGAHVLAGLAKRQCHLVARHRDVVPRALGEANRRPRRRARLRRRDDTVAGEARQHRLSEMLSHFVEAQTTGLTLGVAATRA
jgi:hypothetical protein